MNLRTFDHFDDPPAASSERTRQKYAPFGSIVLWTKRRFAVVTFTSAGLKPESLEICTS